MDFFHPLTLGVARRRAASLLGSEPQTGSPYLAYESWREGLEAGLGIEEEQPEASVLDQLRAPAAPLRGTWLVLGEPGAGKSRLLEEWHARWLAALGPPQLGARVPMLIRLREATEADLALGGDALADRLAALAWPAIAAAVKGGGAAALAGLPPRMFAPVWLLDGLDEAPLPAGDAGLWDRLASLPGDVVITCRTAVFEAARRGVAGHIGKEWRILGLRPAEQPAFLARALDAEGLDPSPAAATVRAVNENAALRPLAAVPLLLRLVAEAADRLVLPHNRAGFYTEATEALWARRLQGRPALFDLAVERDAALTALARAMGLGTLEADAAMLKAAGILGGLRDALQLTGLLRLDERRQRASFPHLTFQEFFLARAWMAEPFAAVLEAHWADARCEEALGVLVALHWEFGRGRETEAALQRFVDGWRERHARDPSALWHIGRSPHAVALALLARAGVAPADALLGAGAAPLPVRENVAALRHLGATGLAQLARDPDMSVRWWVSRNPATPLQALRVLACDPEKNVRLGLANNPAVPHDLFEEFAEDPDPEVRQAFSEASMMPDERAAEFEHNRESHGFEAALMAEPEPPEALRALAEDPDENVRAAVAGNTATPAETLNALARDETAWVRALVGANRATPAETLAALADDPAKLVREWVAENRATPPDTFRILAYDSERQVRENAARNPAAPPELLHNLTHDPDPWVRQRVAENTAAPAETLARLTADGNHVIRVIVRYNRSTLIEDLWLAPED